VLVNPATHQWMFTLNSGTTLQNRWAKIRNVVDGVEKIETFHFGADGTMTAGWFLDTNGKWYYLSEVHDGGYGHMVNGWLLDSSDQKWYYLNMLTGSMEEGWEEIDGKWYYFNQQSQGAVRPLGSMYCNEMTPDGYQVDYNGVWEKETPRPAQ
jgi:glucan-binding YG repeat protein